MFFNKNKNRLEKTLELLSVHPNLHFKETKDCYLRTLAVYVVQEGIDSSRIEDLMQQTSFLEEKIASERSKLEWIVKETDAAQKKLDEVLQQLSDYSEHLRNQDAAKQQD